jgi:site-specific DNA recombinase
MEKEIKERFLLAFNKLMGDRDGLIEDCKLALSVLTGNEKIEKEIAEQMQELEVVAELSRKAIYENARTAMVQEEFETRNKKYLERHQKAAERIEELEKNKLERIAKRKNLKKLISMIKKSPESLQNKDRFTNVFSVNEKMEGNT